MGSHYSGLDNRELTWFEWLRETAVCWWVLIRARLARRLGADPRTRHCLQLKKGHRFRLEGAEIERLPAGEDTLCSRRPPHS